MLFFLLFFIWQPIQEVDSVVKLKENSLPKDCPLKSLQSRKLLKNFLLLGSGPSLNPNPVYHNKLLKQKSQIVIRNKELESELVMTVLIFHPVRVNTIKQHFYACHKFMQICQNSPLDTFMRSSVLRTVVYGVIKIYAVQNLCNQCLTHIIRTISKGTVPK